MFEYVTNRQWYLIFYIVSISFNCKEHIRISIRIVLKNLHDTMFNR